MPSEEMSLSTRPASLACLECRRVHLRCDGIRPACARCVSRDLQCNYTTSKRGRRRGRHRVNELVDAHDIPSPSSQLSPTSQWVSDPSLETRQTRASVNSVDRVANSTPSETSLLPQVPNGPSTQQTEITRQWIDDEWLVNLYYLNFHPNHPILVPKNMYWKRDYPWYLKAVVEFIGGHFLQGATFRALQEDVRKELERDGCSAAAIIQARLLYATVLLASNESQSCQRLLSYAVDAAIGLGLHRRGFAIAHANGQLEEEESLRRTWYELYVLDGCVAASQRGAIFRTYTVNADVLLPCEDKAYDNGMAMSTLHSRNDFERSAFVDEEVVFSSFCYRIEAARLLGRVLTITGRHGVQREQVQAIDNALVAFLHHLPPSKRETEIVRVPNDTDVLILQTHMIIQYATILLHFPRSDLMSLGPLAADISGSSTSKFVCPCTRQQVHSVKAIDASRAISMLATFRVPIQRHTALSIYPLVMCAMVQLSLCRSDRDIPEHLEHHWDCIKLILGVLKSMGQYWSTAQLLHRALKTRALRQFQNAQNNAVDSAQQESSTVDATTALVQATNGGEIRVEDTIQPAFNEFMNLDELTSLDNGYFCF